MPNLKKTKKDETFKEVFKDKYLVIFMAIVLVVAINHLVFSYLLINRDQAKAFSSSYMANFFTTLGDQSIVAGSTDVKLAQFFMTESMGNDALACNYDLTGNPCVTFIDGDGTATTTPGIQDDPITYLTDLEVNGNFGATFFQPADGICTDSSDPTIALVTCLYFDTTDGTACTDGSTADAYILGTGCASGSDSLVPSTFNIGVPIWQHYENPLGTSGAYDSGEDIFVWRIEEDIELGWGSASLYGSGYPNQWQGDTPGTWIGAGDPGGEGYIDWDGNDNVFQGNTGTPKEPVIIDLDSDQFYTDGPDTLLDADGSDTGVGTVGIDDDNILAGTSLTGLAVPDGICSNGGGQGGVGQMIIYQDGNGDCVPGNGGTDTLIRDDTTTGLPAMVIGLGTFPYTFIPAVGSIYYYDNNPTNGAYDLGASAAATESLWAELQGINEWHGNIEGPFSMEADGTGSIVGNGVGPNIDDDPVSRGAPLTYLQTTDFICVAIKASGAGFEDIYFDGSGIPGECIPSNGGVDIILMDVSANGLIAPGTFDGTWASAAGTLAYFEHIGGAGYDFDFGGVGAPFTESLWIEFGGNGTYTGAADTNIFSINVGLEVAGDNLEDLSSDPGPGGQPLIYTDPDASGTLTATDTVLEDIGNLQTGPGGVPNGIIDRVGDMLDRIVLQNAGTADFTDMTNLRLYVDIWWWGGDGQCDTSDNLVGDFVSDGTLINVVTNFTQQSIGAYAKACIIGDIPVTATGGNTIQLKIPALSDLNTNGRYDTGDLGWFNYSANDGPVGGDVLAPDTFTIAGVTSEGGIRVTEDMKIGDLPTLGGDGKPVTPGQPSLPGDLQVGDLIKSASSNSVFVVTSEGKRNIFPSEAVFYSYLTGFDNIKAVSDNIISQLSIGRNITMRPGTNLIKLQTNPAVYAVEPGGVIRMIEDEAMATSFYGTNWAQKVVDVSDAYWPDYIEGDPLEITMYPTGTILRYLGSGDVWYIDEGIARLVSQQVFEANNYQEKYVVSNVIKNDYDYDIGEALEIMDMFEVKIMMNAFYRNFFK